MAATTEGCNAAGVKKGHLGIPEAVFVVSTCVREQSMWQTQFPDCGGEAQSPINIEVSNTTFDPTLLPITLTGHDLPATDSLRLSNNGHTVTLELPESLQIVQGLPLEYRASQLHFHWGSAERMGSEHTVDGRRYPGEIHIVYFSSQYTTFQEAMDKPGGLAVLGAFIEVGPMENPHFAHLLPHLAQVANKGQDAQVPGFNIAGLLPDRLDRYYRYNGSLTTPPCFQSVIWTVFNDIIKISQDQLALLQESVRVDDKEVLQLNFRDVQSLNCRPVLRSFSQAV